MSFNKKDNKNLLLNQINNDGSNNFTIVESVPLFSNENDDIKFLSHSGDIGWTSITGSDNIIITNSSTGDIQIDCSLNFSIDPFENTPIYFRDGQIGIDRYPLHEYKIDVGVPVNTRSTALHIGDGVFGLSMGNATSSGFLPQIIGIGSDEDDAGLYFIGKVIEGEDNSIPAIVFDARNVTNEGVYNRPIFGISSGSYSEYKMIMNAAGNVGIGIDPGIYKMNIGGSIKVENVIIDDPSIIINLKQEIQYLRDRIFALEEKIN